MAEDTLTPAPEDTALRVTDTFDRMNARSVINLVPQALQNAFLDASKKEPDLFSLDENDLYKRLKADKRGPNSTDNRLRLAFWMEYDKVQSGMMARMNMHNVYGGVCPVQYFYANYLASASRVAWLLCPPTSYTLKLEEALDYGIDRLRDILSRDPDDYGKDKIKFMELQTKIILALDQRVKGAVVQRIEQKNMNLNISSQDTGVAKAAVENSMDSLNRRLADLHREEKKLLNLPVEKPEPKEVKNESS